MRPQKWFKRSGWGMLFSSVTFGTICAHDTSRSRCADCTRHALQFLQFYCVPFTPASSWQFMFNAHDAHTAQCGSKLGYLSWLCSAGRWYCIHSACGVELKSVKACGFCIWQLILCVCVRHRLLRLTNADKNDSVPEATLNFSDYSCLTCTWFTWKMECSTGKSNAFGFWQFI